jgi:hypothetical protein
MHYHVAVLLMWQVISAQCVDGRCLALYMCGNKLGFAVVASYFGTMS